MSGRLPGWLAAGYSLIGRQRDRGNLIPAHDGVDAAKAGFDRFNVSVRKVVQRALVGLRTRQPADHRIVQCLRKAIWHIHHYPKVLDAAEIPREKECYSAAWDLGSKTA